MSGQGLVPISVTVLTKNSADFIRPCLDSLRVFAEVIILDNGSDVKDGIATIASFYPNVVLHKSAFIGFGPLKNLAAQKARYDWILTIDSDEVLSLELILEISNLSLVRGNVYALERYNYLNGRHISACGWANDVVVRLYNRLDTAYTTALVHEGVITDGLYKVRLQKPLIHNPMRSVSDFIDKMQLYSSLFAETNRFRRRMNTILSIVKGGSFFVRDYFLKRGFLYGYEGFVISISDACGVWYKCLKLQEANGRLAISVVIDTAGVTAENLSLLLDSVQKQDCQPVELCLLGDDEKMRKLLSDTDMATVFSLPLKYVSQLSDLVEQCTGEYLVFLQSAFYLPEFFLKEHIRLAWRGIWMQAPVTGATVTDLPHGKKCGLFGFFRCVFRYVQLLFGKKSGFDKLNLGFWKADISAVINSGILRNWVLPQENISTNPAKIKARRSYCRAICYNVYH